MNKIDWHQWFAWKPVFAGISESPWKRKLLWLRPVERRLIHLESMSFYVYRVRIKQ